MPSLWLGTGSHPPQETNQGSETLPSEAFNIHLDFPAMTQQLKITTRGLSFFDPDSNIGVRDLGLSLVMDEKKFDVELTSHGSEGHEHWGEANVGGLLKIRTTASPSVVSGSIVLTHCLTNISSHPVVIASAVTGQFHEGSAVLHGKGSWLGWELRYVHTDNVRTEKYPHCQMEYPYERMLPVHTVELGAGEDQAFPALYVKDLRSRRGIVFAAASQELNYTTFTLRKKALVKDGIFEEFTINHDPGHAGGFTIPAGSTLQLDGLFIQLVGDVRTEDCFSEYLDYLGTKLTFRGAHTPVLEEAFHCTWNYGPFADQTEKALLPTAEFLSSNAPAIKWFLIDAGYIDGGLTTTFLDQFYPDPNQNISQERWPGGMRAFADKVRRLGLRPGLWWSPTARTDSKLFADHEDWFLRRSDGTIFLIDGNQGFLDLSNPDALGFLDKTLSVILGEWGMDACKMDFWSQNVETRDVLPSDPSVTNVQARRHLFETVRKHLPANGVFITCVATGMGNPFIGRWADSYRNTIDIGLGVWLEQVNNCFWALPTLGFPGRKSFLPNHDSAGIMAEHPDNENLFRLTWCHINMGLLETGGRMETWPEKWVAAMRKMTDRCDRGHRVRCADDRAFTGLPLPECLFVDFPSDSRTGRLGIRQSVAFFNWSDEPKIINVRRAELGHTGPVDAVCFWSDARETFDGEFISQRLEGRSAMLWDIFK